ncbi:phosphoribosylformylglycinamidine cyclo-ligase [Candidatus Bathyarchaeota archaeon]|nr:phosphoribosylformylglycinamidine cyclo-ligase [Candidatus Bathyarchaeota archaeon]
MPEEFTYAEAGVDREVRTKSKAALLALKETYKLSKYGEVVQLPYGNIFPVGDRYLDFVIEGIGTKVLLAQLADKYDTIGIDGVAMAVNDVIRSGATPLAVVDNIHAQVSNPYLIKEWMKGIVKAVTEAGCLVPGGEIGDVADVIKGIAAGKGFDMIFACIGEVFEKDIVFGNNIKPGDLVIGLKSSGIHSNGISLARKVLFKEWGGKYDPHDIPDGFSREIVYEVLEPTRIYVKPILNAAKEVEIKGAVHITGDAYLKFDRLMKFSKGIGFEFNNFKPQPIFELIQKTAPEVRGVIKDEEMLKTFNMGWGFAVVVNETDGESVTESFQKTGVNAERIGKVTDSRKIIALYKGKKIELS